MARRPCAGGAEPSPTPFGVDGLDELLDGGLVPAGVTLLVGPPGSGKSMLATHFAAHGAALGEATIYVSLEQSRDQLVRDASACGIDLTSGSIARLVRVTVPDAKNVGVKELAADIRRAVELDGARRLVVDGITSLAARPESTGLHGFVLELCDALAGEDVTVLATAAEFPRALFGDGFAPLFALATTVLVLAPVLDRGELARVVVVPKHQGCTREPCAHRLELTASGPRVGGAVPIGAWKATQLGCVRAHVGPLVSATAAPPVATAVRSSLRR